MKRSKGFTLLELLTVIVIISLLVTIVTVAYNKSRVSARDARRKQDIAQVANALQLWYQDNKSYPVKVDLLWQNNFTGLGSTPLVTSGYLSSTPADPWVDASYFYGYCSTVGGDSYAVRARLEQANTGTDIVTDTCPSATAVFKSGDYKVGPISYTSVSSGY